MHAADRESEHLDAETERVGVLLHHRRASARSSSRRSPTSASASVRFTVVRITAR